MDSIMESKSKSVRSLRSLRRQEERKTPYAKQAVRICENIKPLIVNIIRLIIIYQIYCLIGIPITPIFNLLVEGIYLIGYYINPTNLAWLLKQLWEYGSYVLTYIFKICISAMTLLSEQVPAWLAGSLAIGTGMFAQDKATNNAFATATENIMMKVQESQAYHELKMQKNTAAAVEKKAIAYNDKMYTYLNSVNISLFNQSKHIVSKGAPETWLKWWSRPLRFVYDYVILVVFRVTSKIIFTTDQYIIQFVDHICNVLDKSVKLFSKTKTETAPPIDDEEIKILQTALGIEEVQIIQSATDIAAQLLDDHFTKTSDIIDTSSCPKPNEMDDVLQSSDDDVSSLSRQSLLREVVQDVEHKLLPQPPSLDTDEVSDTILKTDSLAKDKAISASIQRTASLSSNAMPPEALESWTTWLKRKCGWHGGRRATRRKPKKLSGRKRRQVGRGRRTKHKNRRTRRM